MMRVWACLVVVVLVPVSSFGQVVTFGDQIEVFTGPGAEPVVVQGPFTPFPPNTPQPNAPQPTGRSAIRGLVIDADAVTQQVGQAVDGRPGDVFRRDDGGEGGCTGHGVGAHGSSNNDDAAVADTAGIVSQYRQADGGQACRDKGFRKGHKSFKN